MKIVIQGVGGIGGITAARLIASGFDVIPVTGNPKIAQQLNTSGFQLELPDGKQIIPLTTPAVSHLPDSGPPVDLVLMVTQAPVMEQALRSISSRLHDSSTVVCFQNGLPEDRAAAIVGRDRVIGCVVGWAGSMVAPGHYRQTSPGGFQVGTVARDRTARVEDVAKVLHHVAHTDITSNLPGVRWSKLAINSAITSLGAAGGDRLGILMRYRFVRRLALEIFTEVVSVANADGIQLEKVNGTFDLERLALTGAERAAPLGSPSLFWKHSVLLAVGMKYRRLRSSMLYALEKGRRPEIDYLNGEIVQRGLNHNIPTPVNQRLMETINEIAGGNIRSSVGTLREIYHQRHRTPKQLPG